MRRMLLIGTLMAVSAFAAWHYASVQAPIPPSPPPINSGCSINNPSSCTNWTAAQWQTFMNYLSTKVDTTNGSATNLTLTSPSIAVTKDLPNTGATTANVRVTTTAIGSGTNGPATAQNALSLSLVKDLFPSSSAAVGEIDPLQIFGRQSGAGSDMSGMLINVQNTGNGFLSATEFASSIFSTGSSSITQQMDVQEGALNGLTGKYYGAVYTADVGALTYGVLVQSANNSTTWTYAFAAMDQNQVQNFSVDPAGNVIAVKYRETLTTPASSSAACTAGQFTDDANFHYVCVAANTWKRAALSSF
jgi:hypothetical protein